ncbi:MAG: hypothetical protein RL238_417 [Actinomycetota bacterium]|jgi:uncharacterized protein (TIGR03083 family)
MPASLPYADYIGVVQRAGAALLACANEAGLDAKVPTCPTWTVAHLVAHQSMVHRWATAHVLGTDPDAVPGQTELRARPDLLEYFNTGLGEVVAALRAAPADLQAMTFLHDVTDARTFWARRQAHETTVHAVDALAAVLGRVPTTDEAGVPAQVADDGIDELLRGFFTRGRSKLYDGTPRTIRVVTTDTGRSWFLRVDEQLTVPDEPPGTPADVDLRGTAAALHLALWNRGDDIEVSGDGSLVARWRTTQRIRWS